MKKIDKNNLELELKEATSILLEMARNSCYNNISENVDYIISEIKNDPQNFSLEQKRPKSLKEITQDLNSIFDNLYDINLHIFKSSKDKTTIGIRYFTKSSLDSEFYESVKDNNPMLHCKVIRPFYASNPPNSSKKEKKFDVNWELGGIRHQWNVFKGKVRFFLWKYRINRQ